MLTEQRCLLQVHRGLNNALRLSKQQSPTSAGSAIAVEKPRGPLAEAVIYVAKKLSGRQCELNAVVQRLGGQYKWRYDPRQVTHVVFEGPPTDGQAREEVRAARRDKKFLVHPAWVHACLEKAARLSEDMYPPEMRVNMRLELSSGTQVDAGTHVDMGGTHVDARTQVNVSFYI